eukprot:2366946-Pyramimonas_sp.AAC.1
MIPVWLSRSRLGATQTHPAPFAPTTVSSFCSVSRRRPRRHAIPRKRIACRSGSWDGRLGNALYADACGLGRA